MFGEQSGTLPLRVLLLSCFKSRHIFRKGGETSMKRLSLLLTLALGFILSGCGSSAPPVISVAVSPNTAQTIDQGQQESFTASVTNDAASKGVTWSVSGGGTLSGSTPTAVTHNAPPPGTSDPPLTLTPDS